MFCLRVATVVVCAAALLLAACEPKDRRPGVWLSGAEVTDTVTDWSFTDEISEIFIETRTWYGVPHSVTVTCVALRDTLYVPSIYPRDAVYPDARFWNRNVVRDPTVRLKIGERVYERQAVLVEERSEWSAVLAAFARKSSFWKELSERPESERPQLIFLRMDPSETL